MATCACCCHGNQCKDAASPKDAILKIYNSILAKQYPDSGSISHSEVAPFIDWMQRWCPHLHIHRQPHYDYNYLWYLWTCAQWLPWWRNEGYYNCCPCTHYPYPYITTDYSMMY